MGERPAVRPLVELQDFIDERWGEAAPRTRKKVRAVLMSFFKWAQAEFKLTDSTTGALLAAGVDRRIGGGSITTAAQWQWGDAENAMTAWAQLAAQRLSSWTKGTAKAS